MLALIGRCSSSARCFLVAASVSIAIPLLDGPAHLAIAACNAIPAAETTHYFFSVDDPANPIAVTGKIDRRLVAPGERVEVAVNACAGAASFEKNKLGSYTLELAFRDFSVISPITYVTLPAIPLLEPRFPASCTSSVPATPEEGLRARRRSEEPERAMFRAIGGRAQVRLVVERPP
jgi:hypothetical protein